MALLVAANGDDTLPPYRVSKGFRLIVNATDPVRDAVLNKTHGREIHGFHIMSVENAAAGFPPNSGAIFFQSFDPRDAGSPGAVFLGRTMAILGRPNSLAFLGLGNVTNDGHGARQIGGVNIGGAFQTTMGMQLSVSGNFSYMRFSGGGDGEWSGRGTFAICNTTVVNWSRNEDDKLRVLFWIPETYVDGEWGVRVPDLPCVPVTLIPQCDVAPSPEDMPNYSLSRPWLERAVEVRCYDDVRVIDWGKYSFRPGRDM